MKKTLLTTCIAVFFINLSVYAQGVYYISNSGNNNNSGRTPFSPWSSIKEYKPGNVYLFKKGDVFYTVIRKVDNPEGKEIKIGSYGLFGKKPVISGYKQLNGSKWQSEKNNIWKLDLKDINNISGFKDIHNTNVGFIKVDGIIRGGKKKKLEDLSNAWDFYSDERYLYIYNASSLSGRDIQAVTNYTLIQLSDNMNISGIALVGTGGHAIQGTNVKNVTIDKVDIKEIGGSFLDGYSTAGTRYGNGVEFWNLAENCTVQNCNVEDVYDVAFTMQGQGAKTSFKNIIFQNNICKRNGQSFEFWVSGNGPGFFNCKFIDNKCYDAGYGWSYDVRPNKISAVHVLNYVFEVRNADLTIQNNLFDRARAGYSYIKGEKQIKNWFKSLSNDIVMGADQPINVLDSAYSFRNFDVFSKTTGLESGSRVNQSKK